MIRALPNRTILFLILFLLGSATARAEASPDWPHLRGPNYDAISTETGLVDAWGENGPPVLWRRELGQGYSGFVAVGGRVWTQFQSRTGLYVVSLQADTGTEVWRTRVDWPWQPDGAYPGPYATPTWHAGRIYYTTPTGQAGCLDAGTGRQVWSLDVRKKYQGKGTEFGYAATPLVEGGRVILPVGGRNGSLVALNPEDGSTVWAVGDDPASYCPAYPITVHGRRLVVAFLRNSVVVHDPATGERLWRQGLSTDYDEHSAWPLYAEPNLLIASPFRVGAQLFRLDEKPASRAMRTVWVNQELSNDVCSSILLHGQVYGFDLHQAQTSPHRASRGRFKCLDFATGKVRWETDKVGQANVLAAAGKLILLNDSGTLILTRATPEAYEELARTRVLDGGLCWTPPTLSAGRLFVRNHTRAVCLFLGSPDTIDPNREPVPPASAVVKDQPFDWFRLIREPDFPHDAPTADAVALWFGWCVLGVFGGAGIIAGTVALGAYLARSANVGRWTACTFAGSAFLLGLAGTTLLGTWLDAFVLTWPASLYVAFRLTLAAVAWAETRPVRAKARWLARAVMLLFVLLCFGYYLLCREVGYVMAWGFLAGFPPAAPAAFLAAWTSKTWLRALGDGVGFGIYFWVSGLLPGWKDHWFG